MAKPQQPEVIMKNNKHIVNAEKIAKLIPMAKTFNDKRKMVKAWANEVRLACRNAVRVA